MNKQGRMPAVYSRMNRMKNQRGFSLIEVLVSSALLGIIGVGIFSVLFDTSQVLISADIRESARNLAQSQMEYIKNLGYATNYDMYKVPNHETNYPEYEIDIDTASLYDRDPNIQKITVTITKTLMINNNVKDIVFTLESYKTNR